MIQGFRGLGLRVVLMIGGFRALDLIFQFGGEFYRCLGGRFSIVHFSVAGVRQGLCLASGL